MYIHVSLPYIDEALNNNVTWTYATVSHSNKSSSLILEYQTNQGAFEHSITTKKQKSSIKQLISDLFLGNHTIGDSKYIGYITTRPQEYVELRTILFYMFVLIVMFWMNIRIYIKTIKKLSEPRLRSIQNISQKTTIKGSVIRR